MLFKDYNENIQYKLLEYGVMGNHGRTHYSCFLVCRRINGKYSRPALHYPGCITHQISRNWFSVYGIKSCPSYLEIFIYLIYFVVFNYHYSGVLIEMPLLEVFISKSIIFAA